MPVAKSYNLLALNGTLEEPMHNSQCLLLSKVFIGGNISVDGMTARRIQVESGDCLILLSRKLWHFY